MRKLLILILILNSGLIFSQVPGHVPTNGLVGWWPFDGNANDVSGNGHHGIVNGAVLAIDEAAIPDEAYYFDGNDRITIPHHTDFNVQSLSILITFQDYQNPAAQPNTNSLLISKREPNGWGSSFEFYPGDSNWGFGASNSIGGNTSYGFGSPQILGQWRTVIYTHDADSIKVYSDGLLIDAMSSPGVFNSNSLDITVGMRGNGWHELIGSISRLGIWNRALTEAEITTIYSGTTPTCDPICNDLTIQLDNSGNASVLAADVFGGYDGACTMASLALSQSDFDCTMLGDHTVTLTATDANGNESSCTADITVVANPNPSNDLSDGLVGFWPFNGNANDESGNGNHGVVNGATLTEDRFGSINSAYYFDGSGQEIILEEITALDGFSEFTLSCWINLNDVTPHWSNGPGIIPIISKWTHDASQSTSSYFVYLQNDKIVYSIDCSQNPSNYGLYNVSADNTLSIENWYHILVQSDLNKMRLYLNGSLVSETIQANEGIADNNTPLRVATWYNSINPAYTSADGTIDDIGIWDRVLTDSEIQELYSGINQSEPTAVCQDITIQLSETDVAIQAGNPVYLNGQGPNGGISMDMSEDGNTIIYGAPYNTDTPGVNGIAVVYEWNGTDWIQKGSTLESTNSGDEFGYTVDISQDGNRIAVRGNQPNGYVNIYEWDGSDWTQLGNAITSGTSAVINGVSLSATGNRVAVKTLNPHYCRVYDWDGTQWTQVGQEIFNHAGSPYGTNVALSPDGTQLAIGGPVNTSSSGVIKVYNFDGSSWVQTGSDITGSSANDWFGQNVIYSPDGTKIGVVAPFDDASNGTGYVAIYTWDGSDWAQFGANIPVDGVNTNYLRTYLSMNQDGSRVAVGAMGAQNNGTNSGQISIFDWNGTQWVQNIENILGQEEYSIFGRSISISAEGSRVAAYSIHTGEFFVYDLLPAGQVTISPSDIDDGSTDNCGVTSLSLDQTTFDCSDIGDNTVTLTVTDVSGNTDACTAVVTVEDNIDPTALCQDITVELDENGLAEITTANIDNGSSDACGIETYSLSQTTFDCDNLGDNTVTLTILDNSGNSAECDAIVSIVDSMKPALECQDITVALDATGAYTLSPMDPFVSATDNCSVFDPFFPKINGEVQDVEYDCSDAGNVYEHRIRVKDQSNNGKTCKFDVTIIDDTAPTAICQDLTLVLAGNGEGFIDADQVDNGSSDACGIAALSLSQTTFNCSNVGTVDLVLTVTDNNNNEATCTSTITVNDETAPEALCQDVIAFLDETGVATVQASEIDNGSNDACGIATVVLSQTDFDCSFIGDNTVTLTVTDINNNASTCQAIVSIIDNIAPSAMCQGVSVLLDDEGLGSVQAIDVDDNSTDNCTIQSLELSQTNFDCSHVDLNNIVTLTVTDNSNNSSTCEATITVIDQVAPEAICQDVTVQLDEDGIGTTSADLVDNGSNDACGIATVVLSQTDFNCNHVGPVDVVLTVTDNNNNTATCDAVVTVEDNIAPEAICQDVTVQLDVNGIGSTTASLVDNGSNDACGIASLVLSQTDFDCSNVGEVDVILTVTDNNNNTATCDAVVTIEDNIAPIMYCPNIVINLNPGFCGQIVDYSIQVSDNCEIETISLLDGVPSGTYLDYHNSSWSATWEATDVNGNSAQCTFTIEMYEYANPTATLACNDQVEVALDANGCTTIGADMILEGGPYGCYDDYIVSVANGNAEVCCDAVGETLLVTVTDPDTGNNCSGFISVVDHLAPTCASIVDYTITCEQELPTAADVDHIGYPVFEDNCGIESIYISSETTINDSICSATGIQIERTWLAIDIHGNGMAAADACIQIITIERSPLTFPVDVAFDCTNYTLDDLTPDLTGSPFPAQASACMYSATYSDQILPTCGGLSKIIRTWTVYDMCTNEEILVDANGTSHKQIITLFDAAGPTFELPELTLSTDVDQCAFTGFIAMPAVMDNCTGVETIQMFISGTTQLNYVLDNADQVIGGYVPTPGIGLGLHTLQVTAIDSCGNATTQEATITIEDQINPTAVCNEITQVSLTSAGSAVVFAATFDNGSHDNCCLDGFEVRRMEDADFGPTVTFDCEDLTDTIQVVLRVADCHDNTNTCMVQVLVEDKIPPYLSVPADDSISCDVYYSELAAELEFGNETILDEWFGIPIYGDNCSTVVDYTFTYGVDQCGIGSIIRTWTVVDGSGNGPITATQTIDIYHVSDWDITFPGEITVNCTDGGIPDVEEPIITGDNCEVIAVTYTDNQFDIVSGACYKIIREWSAINWCTYPNEPAVTAIQIINVEDTEAPIFDVEDFTVEITEADCDTPVVLPTPDVTDCSDDITITVTSDLPAGEAGPGIYTANYVVSDGCGNYSYDEVTITVIDAKAPTPFVTDQLVTEIMQTGITLTVQATDFDIASFDNCSDVQLSFSADINHTDTLFTCDNLGLNELQIWVTDAAGNQDYATVILEVQDNMDVCGTNPALTVAGALYTNEDETIESATVDINGGLFSQTTAEDGLFSFDLEAGGDYTVAPELDLNPSNGVTTLDMVLLTQHILGTNPITDPYRLIAADANHSASITTMDAVAIRMVILQIASGFPNNTSWRFVDANHVFADPLNPWGFPEVINYNDLATDQLNTDFIGVKIGDLNGSAQANFMSQAENRTDKSIQISANDAFVQAGQEVKVSFTSDAAVSGYQFTLNHDGLELITINNGLANAEHFGIQTGALTASWNDMEIRNLTGEELFSVTFRASSDVQLSDVLTINSRYTAAEAYTTQGIEGVALTFNGQANAAYVLYQNEPNPFNGTTTIGFDLAEAGQATLTIRNVNGQAIHAVNGAFEAGYNEIIVRDLNAAGVLYYTLESGDFTATKKMVIIE